MTKHLSLLILLAVIIKLTACQNPSEQQTTKSAHIIPKPLSLTENQQVFSLNNETVLIYPNELSETALYLKETLQKQGIELKNTDVKPNNRIILALNDSISHKEAYCLTVNSDSIKIEGQTPAGVFYGIQSLRQIISENDKNHVVTGVSIYDYPRFSWRGMHLDVSRHFFDKEFIKEYLDILAMYKINTFHWHLTDDQGWRIEIKSFPKLTELGAWRKGTATDPWNYEIEPAIEGQPKYGGYYTQDDIREIIAYAKQRHITIVPEIEMPGHSWAALYAYPELSCSGVPFKKPDDVPFEFTDPYCAGNEQTFAFFEAVLSEVIDLFPSPYIHIGGDECKKTPWEHCPKCQQRIKTEGLKNVEELQSYFIKRIERFVRSKDRHIIGWGEILEGGLAPGAAVMSWRSEKSGIEAARSEHYVVMTPGSHLYFNRRQAAHGLEKDQQTKVLTLEKVYSYEPIPELLSPEEAQYIMGVQACLWTEHTPNEEKAQENTLPRLLALAEVAWTKPKQKNYTDFNARLSSHLSHLDANGIIYFIPPPSGLEDDLFIEDNYTLSMKPPYPDAQIRYTSDGSQPNEQSSMYDKALTIKKTSTIKAQTVMPSGRTSAVHTATIKQTKLKTPVPAKNLTAGLRLTIYDGQISTLDSFNTLNKQEKTISPTISIPERLTGDYYGLEFEGYIKVPQNGVYTFILASDDGSRLYLNNELLIDHDGVHGAVEKTQKTALKAGFYPFKLLYFEALYGQDIKLFIIPPNGEKKIVPAGWLFSEQE